MFYNLAQYKLGQVGDRMFAMDNNSVMSVFPRQNLILIHNGAKQLYYQYGKINYTCRWCYGRYGRIRNDGSGFEMYDQMRLDERRMVWHKIQCRFAANTVPPEMGKRISKIY
jgi:hypothetical protein